VSLKRCNPLIGYSLRWLCFSLVWAKSLLTKTGFDPVGRDLSVRLLRPDFTPLPSMHAYNRDIEKSSGQATQFNI
jgi:hypothetical protein